MQDRCSRPFLITTPSARKRFACSLCAGEEIGNTMRPPAPRTRCQGRLIACGTTLKAKPVSRARPGSPAARATAPYVETCPRGMVQTTSQIAWMAGLPAAGAARRGRELFAWSGRNNSEKDLPERAITRLYARAGARNYCEVRKRRDSAVGLRYFPRRNSRLR